MKIISQVCPNCGAQLQVDPSRGHAFCQYCGSKLLFDDGSTTININQRIIDEARLKEAEVRLKELEYRKEITDAYAREKKSWTTIILIYAAVLAVSLFMNWTDTFVYTLIFGGIAVYLLRPKRQYANEVVEYTSMKNRWVALILCFFFGIFGVHYFYVGRMGMGILYLITFGFGGLGWLFDMVRIVLGVFRDNMGRPLR